jgi:hypothetical protein
MNIRKVSFKLGIPLTLTLGLVFGVLPAIEHLINLHLDSQLSTIAKAENVLYALQSAHSGMYVRAGVGSGSALAAVSSQILGWETFRLVSKTFQPNLVYLESNLSGARVRADQSPDHYLAADCVPGAEFCGDLFRVVPLEGSEIALQHYTSGKFVRAGIGQNSRLGAASDHILAWEKFKLIRLGISMK